MKKLLLTLVFVLLIVAVGAHATLGWDNTPATAEEVTATDNYIFIETEADFLDFMTIGRYTATENDVYVLTSDIYLDRLYAGGGKLGTTSNSGATFNGTFDGRGHAIVGLKEPLFDIIGESGVVDDLLLIGVEGKEGSILNSNPKYALAYLNKGTIKYVHMTGEVEYSAFVGTNSGTIQHSLAVIKRANMVEGKETMLFAYENTGTIDEQYSYAYDVNNDKEWGNRSYFIDADSIDYVVVNQALVCNESLFLRYGVNLFNTPFVVPQTMNNATIGNKLAGYIDSNSTFTICYYNADYLPYEIDVNYNFLIYSNVVIHNTPGTFSGGDGTKENPYEIGTIEDLMTLATLQEGEYAMLVENIILDERYLYGANQYLIEELNGHFDGNGHTITMGNFKNASGRNVKLFNTINPTGTVTDLFMSGYLADYNYGTISNVTGISVIGYEYNDVYIAFISFNAGTIIRSHAEGFAGLVGNNTLDGQMIYCSSKNNLFVYNNNGPIYGGYYEMTEEKTAFSTLFDGNTFNLPNAIECVGVNKLDANNPIYAYTSDIDLANFPTVSTKEGEYFYTNTWAFGQDGESGMEPYSWGYLNNNPSDLPILVRPENRLAYKKNLRANGYYAEAEYSYGTNSGRRDYVLRTLPLGTDTTSYTPFDDVSDNLFVGANGHVYELLSTASGNFSVASAEHMIKSGLSVDAENYLLDKELNWTIRAIGDGAFAPFIGTTFDSAVNPNCEFYLLYEDSMVYLEAMVTLTDSLKMEYAYVEKCVGLNTVLSALDVRNTIGGVCLGMEYATDSNNIFGYSGISYSIKDGEGNDLGATSLYSLETDTEYFLYLTMPSTATITGTTFKSRFVLTKGTFDVDGCKIESGIGGLTEESALTYDKEVSDLSALLLSSLALKNFSIGNIVGLEIVSLTKPNGWDYNEVTAIRDAGVYTVNVTIRIEGFNDATKQISFHVLPKEVEVYVKVNGQDNVSINYYDDITVTYHDLNDSDLSELVGLSYGSDYFKGSAVTTGENYYVVSFAPPGDDVNLNYVIKVANRVATVKVNPVKITLDEGAFQSRALTYDGLEHAVTLDESKINKNTLEPTALDYSLVYYYASENSNTPYAFSGVGSYNLEVQVVSSNPNYISSDLVQATLTITKKAITIRTSNSTVSFGDDAEYSYEVIFDDGVPTQDEVNELLVLGTHYTITSPYVKGESDAGATGFEITFTLLPYAPEDAGALVNYDISVSETKGVLTILKKFYKLDMVDSYVYTGMGVKLDFKGEEIPFAEGYPQFKIKRILANEVIDYVGTPANACDSSFSYVAYIKIDETDEHVGSTNSTYYPEADSNGVIAKEFVITPKNLEISGLYVTHGALRYALEDNLSFTYDKTPYVIDIDRNEFAGGLGATFTYSYILYDGSEVIESNSPISLTDATRIKEVSLTISNGNNYNPWTSTEVVTSFTITPREIALEQPSALAYKGIAYDLAFISERVNALEYQTGYAPISGDDVDFTVTILGGLLSIINPGNYTLEVTSNNSNYVLKSDNVLHQMINSGNATINLEGYSFPVYEYGTLGATEPYVIAKDFEFEIDTSGQPIKQDVKFFIDFNATNQRGSFAPGTYNITSAESLTGIVEGEVTEFLAFTILNGLNKIVIKPIEITFDYKNMLSEGVGIKDSYVYGDEAVKTLPDYVNKTQVSPVNEGSRVSENPGITVTPDRTIRHVGSYTFTATASYQTMGDDGTMVDCYVITDSAKTHQITVEKREVVIELTPVTIYLGEDKPSSFAVRYPVSSKQPLSIDKGNLAFTFTVPGFNNQVESDYAVTVSARLKEGNEFYDNYIFTKSYPNAKELSVRAKEFDGVTVSDATSVYTSQPVLPVVIGAPMDATVTFSTTPVNAGTYSVEVTIEKVQYRTLTFTATVTITKATPTIQFTGSNNFPYDVRHTLQNSDVFAYVHNQGMEVEGEFYFMKTNGLTDVEYLRYGSYEYKVGFNPTDTQNYNEVSDLTYTMNTYVEDADYTLTANDAPVGTVISAESSVTFKLVTSERVQGVLHLLVDGNNTFFTSTPNEYVINTDRESVLVDIMIQNSSIYTIEVKIDIENEVVEEEPEDPNPTPNPNPGGGEGEEGEGGSGSNEGTNQGGSGSNEGNSTDVESNGDGDGDKKDGLSQGAIIGIIAGCSALAMVGVVILLIILKKKKQ